jgi:hypothetical protein
VSGLGSELCAAQIVAAVPGRLRIRVPQIKHDLNVRAKIVAGIGEEVAHSSIKTSSLTGAITVNYDSELLNVVELIRSVFARFGLGLLDSDSRNIANGSRETATESLADRAATGAKRFTKLATGGLGLRTALPAGLGALALHQLRRGPKLRDAPWYVTAWYAYNLFDRLNLPHQRLNPSDQCSCCCANSKCN